MGGVTPHPATVAQKLSAPERLTDRHDVEAFASGEPALDDWLRRRALTNEESGASRTYVVCAEARVLGFYCLSSGAVQSAAAPGRVRRNMPDPIPVMVLGRLGVDKEWQGQKLGRALVRDAVLRVLQAAEVVGIRALLVHAKSERAKAFYESCGFSASPLDPMVLMVTLADARKALGL